MSWLNNLIEHLTKQSLLIAVYTAVVDLHRNLSQKHYMFASEIEPAVAV